MVTGSRFLADDGDGFRSSAPRRLGIRIFSAVLSRVVGQRVTDPTSGLRMCDRRGIELFARDYPHDYPEVEAVLLMHAHALAQRRGARCGCARAPAACPRSTRRARSTT